MKSIKFLLLSFITTCWSLGVSAQTDMTGAPLPETSGEYYVYNVYSKRYLGRGCDWGTRASLDMQGLPWKVEKQSDGTYTLTNLSIDGHALGCLFNSDGSYYVDNYINENRFWTIEIIDNTTNTFTMKCPLGGYLRQSGGDEYVTYSFEASDARFYWVLIPRSEREDLTAASASNPVDMTYLIFNQSMNYYEGEFALANRGHWTVSVDGGIVNYRGGNTSTNPNSCMEFWSNNSFNISQTLNVPNGAYRLKAQGFYRVGNGVNDANAARVARAADNEEINAYFYANEKSVPFPSIFDSEIHSNIGTEYVSSGQYDINGTIYYIPTTQARASKCFADGYYETSVKVVVTDGTLTIGAKNDVINNSQWAIFDNFRIEYLGEPLDIYEEALAEKIAEAESLLDEPMHNSVLTALQSQISAAQDVLDDTYHTKDQLTEAISATNASIVSANANIADYVAIKEAIDGYAEKAATLDAAGQTKYSSQTSTIAAEWTNRTLTTAVIATIVNAYRSAVKAQITAGSDMTDAIINPSFETGTTEGWTCPSTGDTGAKTYVTTNMDGDYLFNTWGTTDGTFVKQTITALHSGNYRLQCMYSTDHLDGSLYVKLPNVADTLARTTIYNPHDGSKGVVYELVFNTTKTSSIEIGIFVNMGWFRADNFRLTYLGTDITSAAMNVNSGDWSTFVAPFDIAVTEIPEGVTAYTVTYDAENDQTVNTEVETAISACTPVLLKNESAENVNKTFYYDGIVEETDCNEGILIGTLIDIPMVPQTTTEGYPTFVLDTREGETGWYKVSDNENIKANEAYLYIPSNEAEEFYPAGEDIVLTFDMENPSARAFLDNTTYGRESTSVIRDYWDVATPYRKDRPSGLTLKWTADTTAVQTITISEYEDFSLARTYDVAQSVGTYTVYNLLPDRTYYYKVSTSASVIKKGAFIGQGPLRMGYVSSMSNIRDLGGWTTQSGNKVKYGKIYRGCEMNGSWATISDDGIYVMREELGIKADLDIRLDESCAYFDHSPLGYDIEYRHSHQINGYLDLLIADKALWRDNLRFVLDNIKKGRPVYFHCQVGADRTGTMAFLIEGLLGMNESDMYKDYELTSFSALGTDRYKEAIDNMFDYINTFSGSTFEERFITYANTELGLTTQEISDFRAIMLGTYPIENILAAIVAENENLLEKPMNRDVQTALESAMNPLEVDDYSVDALYKAINDAKKSIADYEATLNSMNNIAALVNNLDADGQAAYDGGDIADKYNNRTLDADMSDDLMNAYRTAVKAQTTPNTNMTAAIVNPEFEEVPWGKGWDGCGTGAAWDGLFVRQTSVRENFSGNFAEMWGWFNGNTLKQTITGLHDGYYKVEAYAIAIDQIDSNRSPLAQFFTQSGETVSQHYIHNDEPATLQTEIVKVENGELTIGISVYPSIDYEQNTWIAVDNWKLTYIGKAASATMRVSESVKYGTFIAPFDVEIPEGVSAYGCNGYEGTTLTLVEIVDVIPANTPVILYTKTGVNQKFNGYSSATKDEYTVDYLTGVYEEMLAPVDSYVLQQHGDDVKFYIVDDSYTQPIIRPNHCYLTIDGEAGVKSFGFDFADAIKKVNVNKNLNENTRYNLNGQKVDENYRGIVINNGKKIFIK